MNNKGFAITGIIYTLFILFLMILISVLSGIRIMQRSASNSAYKLKERYEKYKKYEGSDIDANLKSNVIDKNSQMLGLADGIGLYKYEFKIHGDFKKDNDSPADYLDIMCKTYLSKKTEISAVNFMPNDCNKYDSVKDAIISGAADLTVVYKFEEW